MPVDTALRAAAVNPSDDSAAKSVRRKADEKEAGDGEWKKEDEEEVWIRGLLHSAACCSV